MATTTDKQQDKNIIGFAGVSNASAPVAEALKALPVERNISKILANAEAFFPSFMKLLSCSWADERTIRSTEWQLAVLRTAALLDAPYEWDVNEPVAKVFGLVDTPGKLHAVKTGELSPSHDPETAGYFTDRHRLVNTMITELVVHRRVLETTVHRAKQAFGDEGVTEIIMIHGIYALLANVMRSANIELDPPIPGLEDTLRKFNAKAIEKERSLEENDHN